VRGNGIEHTTTGGAGALTLAPVAGKPSYANVFGSTGTRWVEYTVTDGDKMEGGFGALDLATMVLTRSKVVWTWDGTNYSTTPAGPLTISSTASVICAANADSALPGHFGRASVSGGWGVNGGPIPWANWIMTGNFRAPSTPAANVVYFTPVLWAARVPVSKFWVQVNTAFTAGVRFRYALYEFNPVTYLPGKLLFEGTTEDAVDTGGGTGHTVLLPESVYLPNGWYFAALMVNGVTPSGSLRVPADGMISSMTPLNGNTAGGHGILVKNGITYDTFATAIGDNPTGIIFDAKQWLCPMLGN
jgi:hypothetical protein